MRRSLGEELRCPRCDRGALEVSAEVTSGDDIIDGSIACTGCGSDFPIRRSVPRFVESENYARSFGFQWNAHARTQLAPEVDTSAARLYAVTGWEPRLQGQRILEAGSGAGRFTAVAASTGAEVYSFDYSDAVDANRANNGRWPNLHLLQADIYRIPFAPATFDKVLCLGVLQHCPDPAAAFRSLADQVAPGGEIVIDVYALRPWTLVHPKYWLRPLTRQLPAQQLYRVVERAVPVLLPIKRWLADRVPFGEYPAYLVPVAYQREWRAFAGAISTEQLVELSVLDTFDWYSPAYDRPQTLSTVAGWFHAAGLIDTRVGYGPNGITGRGTKPRRERG